MKISNLKKHLVIGTALLAVLSPIKLFAEGGISGGGGDPLEIKFKDIAQNIAQWIASGNARELRLPTQITLEVYSQRMTAVLNNYQIEITQSRILVQGVQKACENFIRPGQSALVRCNANRLRAIMQDASEMYQIVHHEFAALAGLEVAKGARSSYTISRQLSAFLREETVLRLPVENRGPMLKPTKIEVCVNQTTKSASIRIEHHNLPENAPYQTEQISLDEAHAFLVKTLFDLRLEYNNEPANFATKHSLRAHYLDVVTDPMYLSTYESGYGTINEDYRSESSPIAIFGLSKADIGTDKEGNSVSDLVIGISGLKFANEQSDKSFTQLRADLFSGKETHHEESGTKNCQTLTEIPF